MKTVAPGPVTMLRRKVSEHYEFPIKENTSQTSGICAIGIVRAFPPPFMSIIGVDKIQLVVYTNGHFSCFSTKSPLQMIH